MRLIVLKDNEKPAMPVDQLWTTRLSAKYKLHNAIKTYIRDFGVEPARVWVRGVWAYFEKPQREVMG